MVSPSPMLVVLSSVLPPFGISGCCGGSLSHVVFLLVVGVNLSCPRFASTINLRLSAERKTSQAYLIVHSKEEEESTHNGRRQHTHSCDYFYLLASCGCILEEGAM